MFVYPRADLSRTAEVPRGSGVVIIQRNYTPSALPKGTDITELTSRVTVPLTLLLEESGLEQRRGGRAAHSSRLAAVQDLLPRPGDGAARRRSARAAPAAVGDLDRSAPGRSAESHPSPDRGGEGAAQRRLARARRRRRRSSSTASNRGATASSGISTGCSGAGWPSGRRTRTAASKRRCRAAAPTPTTRRRSPTRLPTSGRCCATCRHAISCRRRSTPWRSASAPAHAPGSGSISSRRSTASAAPATTRDCASCSATTRRPRSTPRWRRSVRTPASAASSRSTRPTRSRRCRSCASRSCSST